MEPPSLPFLGHRAQALGYSLLLIVWWIGVWGIADTVIHLVFKGETMKELGVYILMITVVLALVVFNPDLIKHF